MCIFTFMRKQLNSTFDEIEAIKVSILNELDQLSVHQLNFKPTARKWSLLQVAEHLMLAETGSMNYVNKKTLKPDELENYSLKATFRFWFLKFFLNTPIRIKNRVSPITPTLKPAIKDVKLRWEIARKALRQFIDKHDDAILKKLVFKHPIAGRINALQMMQFFKLHLNHHIKQMERVKNHRNYPD